MHHFNVMSLSSRRVQHDLMFMRNVLRGRIDSTFLLRSFSLYVPARATRQLVLFNVPYARVNSVKEGLFVRLPRKMNDFLNIIPQADVFFDVYSSFRSHVIAYVASL